MILYASAVGQIRYWRWVWKTSRFPVALQILRHGEPQERSEKTLAARFMEIRMNVDITGLMTRWDLIQFAQLSDCDDLIEQAQWTAEQYAEYIERNGGHYPLDGMRRTFETSQ